MDVGSRQALANLIRGERVAALGTLREGWPLVTMILYAVADDFSAFYIHASRLAQHSQGLNENGRVGLMIMEAIPEGSSRNPQTLGRLSLLGIADALPRDEPEHRDAMATYLHKYPNTEMNFQLGDFSLYRIVPTSARFVAGFGRIFDLTPDELQHAAVMNDGD